MNLPTFPAYSLPVSSEQLQPTLPLSNLPSIYLIDGFDDIDITFDDDNEPTEFTIPDGYEDNESSFEQWLRDRNDYLMDV